MGSIHLSQELLDAVGRGEIAERDLHQIVLDHALDLCPHCLRELEAYRRAGADASLALRTLLEQQAPLAEQEERLAVRELQELLALPFEARLERVRRARRRFRSASLVKLLVKESQQRIYTDPSETGRLAELARTITHLNPRISTAFDLIVLTTAHMANACRLTENPRQADEHFRYARQIILLHGVTDPEVLARIDDLEGSLRKDQRRFRQAEELLRRAALLYRVCRRPAGAARALVILGDLYTQRGEPELAIQTTRAALALMGEEADPRIYVCARYNLAYQLSEAGRFEEAAELLEVDEDLYRRFPEPWVQLRLAWLRGDIALGLGDAGDAEAAESAYLEARDGFIGQESAYDAAMVSLDLAVLYLRQGRTVEVMRLAEAILPLFQAQDVHREALAALQLFHGAAAREEVTVQTVREVAAFLEEARADPSVRFRSRS